MSNETKKPTAQGQSPNQAARGQRQPAKPVKPTKSAQRTQLRPKVGRSETKPTAKPKPSATAQKITNLVKSVDIKQLLIKNMAFIIMGFIAMTIAPRIAFIPFPGWIVGVLAGAGLKLMVYIKGKNAKKWRKDMEYGSARWGKAADIKPFIDPDPKNNVILTKTESLTMNPRPKPVKYARNKNILVIGGSGSGKTRFFVKPNIMQCESHDYPVSFCCTDPKGQILVEMGDFLQNRAGYTIKVLNTIDFQKSMGYNPFAYISGEKDILKFVTALITNTKGEGKGGDDFWLKAETLLYQALIGYIYYELNPADRNINTLVEMINSMEVREEDENFKNAVDILFEELEKKDEEHFAVRQYKKYKLAAGKTAKSILISCGARLSPFDIKEVRDLMMHDELELDKMGGYHIERKRRRRNKQTGKIVETVEKEVVKRRTALFVIISDTDASFNFIVSLMYSQLFNLLCDRADNDFGGRLPVHVRCLLDEFANIGQIPNFEKLIATIRSREISVNVILQAQSQLKAIYRDNMDTIIGNCDTTLFLGGKEKTTLKEMSDILGKETIDMYNTGESRGQSASYSMNYQKLGKALMSEDEIAVMDGSKCILQVRGVRPFLSSKYDIEKHHNYKYLADADSSKNFDIVEFVNVFKENKAKLVAGLNRKNTKHVVIEINEDDTEETTPAPKTAPSVAEAEKATEPVSPATQAVTSTEPAETQPEQDATNPNEVKHDESNHDEVNHEENNSDIKTDNPANEYNDDGDDDDSNEYDPNDTELV